MNPETAHHLAREPDPRDRVLVVVDPSTCGIDAVERAIETIDPAGSEIRTVVLAAGRTPIDISNAREVLVEATRLGQRSGFTESGWSVVRTVGELADDLGHVPAFDRAWLVLPDSGRVGTSGRLRRALRRRGVQPVPACAA